MAASKQGGAPRISGPRAVLAVLAIAVIAFCGWSAYEFSIGQDPLAFLSGSAMQTVEEGSSSAKLSLSSSATTVTDADVKAQIAQLSYGDEDVALSQDDVNVVLADDGIWVESASDDAADKAVDLTAKRAAALATWLKDARTAATSVTWITEDMAGSVRLAMSYPVDRTSKGEDVASILSGSTGYAISGDTYTALGDAADLPQSGGDAPVLPDGTKITVVAEPTSEGEVLTATTQAYSVLAPAQSKQQSGQRETSGSSKKTEDAITVSISVDGSAVGAGSSSTNVTLPAGSTVFDALKATGVSYNASSTQYGLYVSSIAGLAEKEHGSKSGWTYLVDGTMPMTSCSNYVLSGGESIVWRYVTGD